METDSPVTVQAVSSFLDALLDTASYEDMAINGLQVSAHSPENPGTVSKIAFAVDCGISIVQRALAEKCQLLVVHHGILWGKCEPLSGPFGNKIATMIRGGLSLYAAHLPLDGHIEHGNAAQLAMTLKLNEVSSAFFYKGMPIGVRGVLPAPMPIEKVLDCFDGLEGITAPLVLPFGKRDISTVGIVTGSGSAYVEEVARDGVDLLITGEPKQEAYHAAKDHGVNVVCIGHYASETFGVRALQRVLGERFRVETAWISEPTGI